MVVVLVASLVDDAGWRGARLLLLLVLESTVEALCLLSRSAAAMEAAACKRRAWWSFLSSGCRASSGGTGWGGRPEVMTAADDAGGFRFVASLCLRLMGHDRAPSSAYKRERENKKLIVIKVVWDDPKCSQAEVGVPLPGGWRRLAIRGGTFFG